MTGSFAPGIEALGDLGEIVLGDGELHGRRLHGGDDHDAGRARRGDVIARIDQPQSNPAGDRRGDAAIDEIELVLGDVRLVGLDLGLILLDGEFLIGHRLFGDGLLSA